MAEIEIKVKVQNMAEVQNRLEEAGCRFSDPIRQEDEIFNNVTGATTFNHPANSVIMRIRSSNGKYLLTAKKDRSGELDCVEYEVEVNDPASARGMIELMGFTHTVSVKKTRREGRAGALEICLDEVDGLGSFMEVEKMSEEDGKKVQSELMDFLMKLGVNPADRIFEGYDTMIYEKEHGQR